MIRRGILVSLGPHQPSSHWPGWLPSLQGPMRNENAGPFVQSIKNFKRTTAKHSTKDRALLRARQCATIPMKLVLPMAHIFLQQRLPSNQNLHKSTHRIRSPDLEKRRRRWGMGRGQCYILFTIPNSNAQTFSPPTSNLDHPQTPAFPLVSWPNGQTCF